MSLQYDFRGTPNFAARWDRLMGSARQAGRFGARADLPNHLSRALAFGPVDIAPLDITWRALYFSAKLLDDVTDGDSAHRFDLADGLALLAYAANRIMNHAPWPESLRLELARDLMHGILLASAGQGEEAGYTSPDQWPDPDSWLEIAAHKSGQPFRWVAQATGQVLRVEKALESALAAYGEALGIYVQWADDTSELLEPVIPATALRRPALGSCYLLYSERDPHRRRTLTDLLSQAESSESARLQVRDALEQSGATEFAMRTGALLRERLTGSADTLARLGVDVSKLDVLTDHVLRYDAAVSGKPTREQARPLRSAPSSAPFQGRQPR